MGIVAVSAVERVSWCDDEGLDEVTSLDLGMRERYLNRKRFYVRARR